MEELPVPELLVVSDTHGDLAALSLIFSWAARRGIGTIAFLGDGLPDLERSCARSGFSPLIRAVRGNCDADSSVPFHRAFDFAGRRFLIVHGHLNGVRDGFDSLVFAAKGADADAAFYGHTHVPAVRRVRKILLVNPGSPSRPRGGSLPSFAVVSCPPEGPVSVSHWRLEEEGSIAEYDIEASNPA